MKTYTIQYWIATLFCLSTIFNVSSQTTLNTENFESGNFPFSLWNKGGGDCKLNSKSKLSGKKCVNLRDDSSSASSMYTSNINLTTYTSVTITFDFKTTGFNKGHDFFIEFSNDGGSSWNSTPVLRYIRGVDFKNSATYTNQSATIETESGTYLFTANSRFRFRADAKKDSDNLYIDNVVITAYAATSKINIQGNNTDIVDGDTTSNTSDYTDFGSANVSTPVSKTYTIYNNGHADLIISSIISSNTSLFAITGTPYTTPLTSGNSTSFTVTFLSTLSGTKSSTITINNNDSNKSTYQFKVKAQAEQNFFDSDNDGILDNIDIDDDNDGILDSEEELACKASSISTSTNYKFLNETFGEGNRTTINTTYDAETTYCYENGTAGSNTSGCSSLNSHDLNDGEYTVYYKAGDGDGNNDTPNGEVASWADTYWYTGEDHTSGDTNGRMAMFNASYDPGTFYTATITGALPNIPITYSFWVLNLDTTLAPGIATRLRPNILVEFRDVDNNILASITTGDISPSINGDAANSWHQFTADLTFGVSEFYVYFINNEVGGSGNDLAIDDIIISQTLCDTDTDGVANVFDLDSDNDGIPDVVEAGLGNYSGGNATLTNSSSWVDANNNGMHDLIEGHTTLDSDGDSTPNYLDLDSDNDSIFDVDESGAGNSGDLNYQNGDGDITGDGIGDGTDTDNVRETDIDSDGILEYFTDGILDIYDFYNGGSMSTAYGNSNQGATGSGWQYYVKDTDNDGTPDYLDLTSDGVTYDISKTLYASLDANNDGLIDDSTDIEGDGIIDLFDTDTSIYGSPRDLDRKLQLFFDGRNDYAAENSVINGWSEVSLMTWIKIDPTATGIQIIAGQNIFYMQLNADKSITAYADGNTLTYSTPLNTNQWIHVATTYNDSNSTFKLYINGLEADSTTISGALNTDSSSFTIGRQPDTDSNYFKGYIDEVRIFSKALTTNELQKMIYQEIENNNGIARGTVIPLDLSDFEPSTETTTPLNWSNLERYYRLDTYKNDIIDDLTTASIDTGSGAKIYNTKVIGTQTTPLPFITQQSGSLPIAVTISADGVNGNDVINYDWSIVHVKHNNVTYNGAQKHLGLFIDNQDSDTNPITYSVQNDSELNVSWYLELHGKIDLEGDSQLVQGGESILDPFSEGILEKDQQGTADTYTYNLWSSPVGVSNNTTNNNSYKVTDIFTNINFLTSGYNGTPSPVALSDYWIWKFSNQTSEDYSKWQHVRSTNTLLVGEGFTMKGPGTGSISMDQNYVLSGKPNNGDITLTISSGNDYLVGNPYPSAMDAHKFILDNGNTIAGTGSTTGILYFWEHWGGGSHVLAEYQGGYAAYSLSGGIPAATIGTSNPDVSTAGTPTKIPGRYIPVGQGFFVTAENAGTIMFKNSQRVFQKEDGTNSLFVKGVKGKSAKNASVSEQNDLRMKLRLGFNSVNGIHRQLLTTIDENASIGYDWGYDAHYYDTQIDDMYWLIDDVKYTIQGINETTTNTLLPLGLHTKNDGISTITIDKLENTPSDVNIYLHDKELGVYHNLKESNYEVYLIAGKYLNRFEITFATSQQSLRTNTVEAALIEVYFSNEKNSVVIHNPESKLIETVEMFNILGQSLFNFKTNTTDRFIEYKASQFKTGYYVLKIKTKYGKISQKILIKK